MRQFVRSLIAGVAFAAMAAAAPVQAQTYNWSGWYLGGNVGWGKTSYDWAFNPAISGAAHQAYSMSNSATFYGAQAGAQWQFGTWVLGVEGGVSWQHDFATETSFGNNTSFDSRSQLRALYTIGPRVGYAFNNFLLYAAGGYAVGDIDTDARSKTGSTVGQSFFHAENDHNGWFIGGGAEYALTQNWILGVDYKHFDLQSARHCPAQVNGVGCSGAAGGFVDRDVDPKGDVVVARLSFKFGGDEARAAPLK